MTSSRAVLIPILLLVMASIVYAKQTIPKEIADAKPPLGSVQSQH
jgi:hypothetical protein